MDNGGTARPGRPEEQSKFYYQLKLPEERISFVDDRRGFDAFVEEVAKAVRDLSVGCASFKCTYSSPPPTSSSCLLENPTNIGTTRAATTTATPPVSKLGCSKDFFFLSNLTPFLTLGQAVTKFTLAIFAWDVISSLSSSGRSTRGTCT